MTRMRAAPLALGAAVAAELTVLSFDHAGYPTSAQSVFIALAGVVLFAAIAIDDRGVLLTLRSRPVLLLLALAALSVASAGWTVIATVDSLRWGLVVASYGATALAAGALVRQNRGLVLLAIALVLVAACESVLGLGAAALRELPYAERIGGSWRAGGSFEYSSALALLDVAVLPALLWAMVARRRSVASGAALAGVSAAGVLVLAESRTELALALAVIAGLLIWPAHTLRLPRPVIAAAVILLGAGALGIRAIVGGYVRPHSHGGGSGRIIELAAVGGVCVALWPFLRLGAERLPETAIVPRRLWPAALAILLVAAVAAVAVGTGRSGGRGIEPSGGFLHGRGTQWRAAWQTFLDRPLQGAGANSFLAASAADQGGAPVRYAHQLPLETGAELGIGGFAVVVGLYGTTAWLLWRRRSEAGWWLLAPGVAAFLLANLVDWEWHIPLSAAVWALQLGALAGPSRR